jgi:hypothetical protein
LQRRGKLTGRDALFDWEYVLTTLGVRRLEESVGWLVVDCCALCLRSSAGADLTLDCSLRVLLFPPSRCCSIQLDLPIYHHTSQWFHLLVAVDQLVVVLIGSVIGSS